LLSHIDSDPVQFPKYTFLGVWAKNPILRAWERHLGSQRTIADIFGVSLAFVEKVLRQYRATGDLAPKPHAGGQKPRLGATAQAIVQRLMGANPDATLEELCTGVAAETGVRVSVPTMCRVLQRLGLPRKKRLCQVNRIQGDPGG
jgi:transposase